MSIALEFTQIKKSTESIVGEVKSSKLYEVEFEKTEKINSCYVQNTDLFKKLLKDPHSIWEGEVYNMPPIWNFVFYLQAIDFEELVGFRKENDVLFVTAFDPKPIYIVVELAVDYSGGIGEQLKELKAMLENAIQNDDLIIVKWG